MTTIDGDKALIRPFDLQAGLRTFLLAGIFIVLLMGFLYFARTLIAPVVAAFVISLMFAPVVRRFDQWGVPSTLTAIFCVGLAVALLNAGVFVLGDAISRWTSHTAEITEAFKAKAHLLERPFIAWRELQEAIASLLGTTKNPLTVELPMNAILGQVVQFLSPAIGELVVFFGCLYFFLITRRSYRRFVVRFFDGFDQKLAALKVVNEIERRTSHYFLAVTVVNLAVGLITAVLAYLCGLPGYILIGVIGFVLNYIPYIGPAGTAVVLFVVGVLALPTLQAAALAPLLFVAIATVEGHFLTPNFIGRQMTMSPLSLFLALVFWTWMWGPLGTFLAMPLLIVCSVIYAHIFPDDNAVLPG